MWCLEESYYDKPQQYEHYYFLICDAMHWQRYDIVGICYMVLCTVADGWLPYTEPMLCSLFHMNKKYLLQFFRCDETQQ